MSEQATGGDPTKNFKCDCGAEYATQQELDDHAKENH